MIKLASEEKLKEPGHTGLAYEMKKSIGFKRKSLPKGIRKVEGKV